jgi:hypothetical protein
MRGLDDQPQRLTVQLEDGRTISHRVVNIEPHVWGHVITVAAGSDMLRTGAYKATWQTGAGWTRGEWRYYGGEVPGPPAAPEILLKGVFLPDAG